MTTAISTAQARTLRKCAEVELGATGAGAVEPSPFADQKKLLHELQVHQVELEMQNEELHREQERSELSRNMYAELYDFAPVAYFTLDAQGIIREVNQAGAQLLETDKGLIVNRSFFSFISDAEEAKFFTTHLSMVVHQKAILKCSLKLARKSGMLIHSQLQSVSVTSANRDGFVLTSVVDATVGKLYEECLLKSHEQLEGLVQERTKELTREIEERKTAAALLKSLNAEIVILKDRLKAENIYLQQEAGQQFNFGEIIGQSTPLARVFSQVEQVAPMNATVLLLGETGTGKGVVARAIHSRGARKSRPLITVNCTTLPATLVESELFGRERGAFTGSDARQVGRFELADGGTIFLDEIGEMPLALQSKLLRVIQDGEFERLGNPRTIKTDVRIIAATNRNLVEAIKNGTFREDLYYRLNVFPITIPPLRQRKDDIPLLVNHFIAKFNKKIGKAIECVTKETLSLLQEYHWPGNVRELESVIERAIIVSQGNLLQVVDSFDVFRKKEDSSGQNIKALVELEHDHIVQVLKKTGWRIEGKNGAAVLLGLNASTLRARMRKYGIIRN